MFRKRQKPAPPPPQPGYQVEQVGQGRVFPNAPPAPPTMAMTPEPQRALVRVMTLVVLSNYQQCAQELLQALESAAGQGRYYIAWVATLEHLLQSMDRYRYDACLLDLGCSELKRLEENSYQLLRDLPYVAVLNTSSLNAQMLQALEARGYYGYIAHPFNGHEVDSILKALFQALPERHQTRQPMQENGQLWTAATGPWTPAPFTQAAYQAPPAPYLKPEPLPSGVSVGIPGAPAAPVPPNTRTPPAPTLAAPVAPASPVQAAQPLPPPPSQVSSLPPPPPADPFPVTGATTQAPAITTPLPSVSAPSEVAPLSPAVETPPRPLTLANAASVSLSIPADAFAIEPQLVRHRGLFVCWSPFDGAQRTIAALNLATALAFGGFRTLIGELRRPAGPLASYLQLTKEELSRSLLAAAYASERLLTQKGHVLDQELLENHLLNAIPLDPHDEESPEVHFFLSGPPASPQLLFNTAALDSNQSPFVPELLQMIRQYWDFAFIVVGSSPVDKLHWQAFRACDRLLVFLPPDEAYLTQAGRLLPAILQAANISPSNVDIILTQIDRGLLAEQMDPILRFLEKTASVDDRQPGSLRAILPRKQAQLEEKQLRMLERQLRKLVGNDSLRGQLEGHVKSILKACGLEDKLAGVLPDALPLMQSLRRKNRLLLPLVMQREFVTTPYVSAIRDLLEAWIQIASDPTGLSKRPEARR